MLDRRYFFAVGLAASAVIGALASPTTREVPRQDDTTSRQISVGPTTSDAALGMSGANNKSLASSVSEPTALRDPSDPSENLSVTEEMPPATLPLVFGPPELIVPSDLKDMSEAQKQRLMLEDYPAYLRLLAESEDGVSAVDLETDEESAAIVEQQILGELEKIEPELPE